MSGVLFLLEIVAFVVVAYWAYLNDRAGPEAGDKGILRMKKMVAEGRPAAKPAPRWKTVSHRAFDAEDLASDPVIRGAQPQWKRRLRPRR
jgi:hypothetical protein